MNEWENYNVNNQTPTQNDNEAETPIATESAAESAPTAPETPAEPAAATEPTATEPTPAAEPVSAPAESAPAAATPEPAPTPTQTPTQTQSAGQTGYTGQPNGYTQPSGGYQTQTGYSQQANPYANTQQQTPNPYAPYGTPNPPQPQPPKKEKKKGGVGVGLVIACIIVSLCCGFLGATFASYYSTTSNGTVLYQSVDTSDATGSAGTAAMSTTEVVAAVQDSVVEITTETVSTDSFLQQYVSTGAGSGVIISTDGYIVTNNHVIEDASTITVTLRSGDSYSATLIGTDSKSDIAVVKIEATDLQAAVMGDSDTLVVGESVIAVGNPLGQLGGTITSGIISALNRTITIDGESMELLQTDTAINPGNSGGGLFNAAGQLVGIVNAKSSGSDVEGLGFAIPINNAKAVIEDLLNYGYVTGRVDTGLTFVDISDAQTAMTYRVSRLGVYVSAVDSDSNAAAAGVTAGDCVVSVNGTEVSTESGITAIIDELSIGDTVTFELYRSGETRTVSFVLTEYHP